MVVLDKDLVLNLPFSEGGGSIVYDRSKHQNHGTITGALAVGALEDGSGWLLDWDKRLKITIDHDDIDSDLTDFPIFIPLGTSVGIDSEDVSCVFDEVGANSLKIAVTDSSGIVQCYVEIERWDNGNELAWLWVKVPSVSSSVDTILYLYYDNDHANNTAYVGIPNSAVAENVWDTNFKLVTHMQDDPDNQHIRDSTTTDNDATKGAAGEPTEATGRIDKGQDFDGDDHIVSDLTRVIQTTADFTAEVWIKPTGVAGTQHVLRVGSGWYLRMESANLRAYIWTDDVHMAYQTDDNPLTAGAWNHIVLVVDFDTLTAKIYVNGVESSYGTATAGTGTPTNANAFTYFGSSETPNIYFTGIMDEVRLSQAERSAAYAKASYESGRDHLVTFGGERQRVIAVDWRFGKVLYFDGDDDVVEITDSPSLDITNEMTISAWVKYDTPLQTSGIVGKISSGGGSIRLGYEFFWFDDEIHFRVGVGSGGYDEIAVAYTSTDEWVHWVVVHDGTNLKIYKNGVEVATMVATQVPWGSSNENVFVGRSQFTVPNSMKGLIDEVRIYSRGLSPEEVRTLYEKTTH